MESVYVRYDPADLKSVRLYDEQDRYLYTWSLADTLLVSYLETEQQQIADAQAVATTAGNLSAVLQRV